MKEKMKKFVPQSLKDFRNTWNRNRQMERVMKKDQKRYAKYSFGPGQLNYSQLEARLTKEYHSIEKGLSYENLRLGFGKQVLQTIVELMTQYRDQGYPLDRHVYQTALSNLDKYIKIHEKNNYDVSNLKKEFLNLKKDATFCDTGGVYYENKNDVLKKTKADFKDFSLSRHSIRDYSEEPVSYDRIEKALKLATHTPSACNRQTWKVRIVEDPKLKKYIQQNQNGNRGFGDYIDKFIIITADVQYYERGRERNQANIDGGMYAMNLLYAFHYYEIAAIPLSGSLSIKQEDNLREKFDISEAENFIMFIGVGNFADEYKIAKSDRRPMEYKKY